MRINPSPCAKTSARRHQNMRFLQQQTGKLLRTVAGRHAEPEEESALCVTRRPAQRSQSTQNPLPTLMIDRRQLRNPFGRQVERGDRRILNRAKHRAVAMGVQLLNARIIEALPTAKPKRQPAILKVLEKV